MIAGRRRARCHVGSRFARPSCHRRWVIASRSLSTAVHSRKIFQRRGKALFAYRDPPLADRASNAFFPLISSIGQHWPRSLAEARLVQERLRAHVVTEDQFSVVQRVAGVDTHYDLDRLWAAIVVMTFPDLGIVESALINRPLTFPYVPGLLSFREAPATLELLDRLSEKPDLLLVDGHGLAHPRRFGLACHLGVLADVPTIGVAKSRLVGTYREPGIARGAWSELVDRGETIGAVLRTRSAVRPVFVSIGHRVSLKTAIDLVLGCTGRFRLPEPIRVADILSRC